ncbi:MAG TPA: matrixin family metalloprotease [Phycisphaerales bacterium]|jgi:hypothetical protein|nr:matrixin family metalloprotease [Phycisphaerales bacterium]
MFNRALHILLVLVVALMLGMFWPEFSRSGDSPRSAAFTWPGEPLFERAWLCPETAAVPDHRFTIPGEIFFGAGVSEEEVVRALRLTSGVLMVYGGQIDIPATMTRLEHRRVLSVRVEDLTKSERHDPEALARRTLTGLRNFMARVAHPVTPHINLVFLEEIVHPSDLGGVVLGEVMGMGLSPQLVAESKMGGATEEWVRAAGLHGDFTPTLIVSMRVLRTRTDQDVGITLVHELGHALGLAHEEDPKSLMAEEPPSCIPALSLPQRQAFEARREE